MIVFLYYNVGIIFFELNAGCVYDTAEGVTCYPLCRKLCEKGCGDRELGHLLPNSSITN